MIVISTWLQQIYVAPPPIGFLQYIPTVLPYSPMADISMVTTLPAGVIGYEDEPSVVMEENTWWEGREDKLL